MQRQEALKAIYPVLENQVVVTNMGAVAVELYNLGHRPNFFYLEHSMGLGLALCLPGQRVTVLDGDASVLMNLASSTLSTMARYHPPNLIHLIFDNESLLSVGGFPSATSTGTDLAWYRIDLRRPARRQSRHDRRPGRRLRNRLKERRPVGSGRKGGGGGAEVLCHGHRPA